MRKRFSNILGDGRIMALALMLVKAAALTTGWIISRYGLGRLQIYLRDKRGWSNDNIHYLGLAVNILVTASTGLAIMKLFKYGIPVIMVLIYLYRERASIKTDLLRLF
jgi:hypothetical protein